MKNKLRGILVTMALGLGFIIPGEVDAATHTVSGGETLWSISRQHGVPINSLLQTNGLSTSSTIKPGQTVSIPTSTSSSSVTSSPELDLLYAVVMQESGVNTAGNRAVTSTILNRVNSSRFPNTITEVLYQPGQFASLTGDGLAKQYLNGKAPQSVKDNVNAVLSSGSDHNYLFFWADWYYAIHNTGQYGVNYGGNVFFNM